MAPTGFAAFLLTTSAGWGQAPAPLEKTAIEEVVVTAQLRSQKIQKVPISINAFSSAFLKQTGSQTLADLQKYTPGLSVDDTSTTQPSFSIRGVSRDDFGVGTDPAVGIYVDGFYAARSGESLVFFDDVERVEVLKGPQGTLFGRNTAAGAISITTNKPTEKFEGMIDEKLGNYGKNETNVMVNVPVTDTFALRVDGLINRRAGYLTNAYNGDKLSDEHNEDVRVAARWQPTQDWDILLAWQHDNTNVAPPTALGFSVYAENGGNPYGPIHDRVINGQESRRLDDASLIIKRVFDGFTVTSLSGFKAFSTQNRESETGSDLATRYFDTENVENNHNFYQELRANGVWNNLTWVTGASYYQEHAKQESYADALTDSIGQTLYNQGYTFVPGLFQAIGLDGHQWSEVMRNLGQYKAASLFGDATYAVTPQLNLTVGVRFTKDDKKFSWQAPPVAIDGVSAADLALARSAIGNIVFAYPGTPPNQLPQGTLVRRAASWTNASPRFVVDYHWLPDLMTYASATYGYKAGGFNSVEIASHFAPEHIQNYEIGLKSDWLDHRLRFNLTGYYYTYTNYQTIVQAPVQNSPVPEYVTQSGNLEGKGVDLELIAVPVENLTLSLTGGYLDSTWSKRVQGGMAIAGNASPQLNLTGEPTGEPELRVVAGADYLYDLADRGNLRLHFTDSFTTAARRNASTLNTEQGLDFIAANEGVAPFDFGKLPGYYKARNLADARVTWSSVNARYQVAMYAQNLFDQRSVTGINAITATALGTPYVRPEAPRFWGAELTYKF